MGRERRGHTLQPTALVNEAFLRLTDARQVRWQDRAHFFGISARLMRRVLVDHARAHGFRKRGGGAQRVTLDEGLIASPEPALDLVALDRALEALAAAEGGSPIPPMSQDVTRFTCRRFRPRVGSGRFRWQAVFRRGGVPMARNYFTSRPTTG